MPKLIIDDREIEVPAGTKVIQAAERLGIMIPRFCFHEALGSLGACRLCAVKFKEGPVKGIEMSCMVEARDGMVVSTTDPDAVSFRKWIIECLMLNHPHDCPVCDEGGHCLLQDETVSGGHGIRRYQGKKRTYVDQDLGPFVRHEMNRCIHCWRCRRFYQDFSGYRDLGALQIANRTYFGRFESGRLENPFSGNLIDLCPTGVYTDKPARFKGRRWNFERGPSLCPHCSLGCNTTGSARYREMVRQEARLNEDVNGYFICDRGRFGFDFANHPHRPRNARSAGEEVSWERGIETAAERLGAIVREAGPDAVLCVGSPRCSLETQVSLRELCRVSGWSAPRFFLESSTSRKVRSAVSKLDEGTAVSMRRIEDADFVLLLGADPVNEAPMSALAVRQAQRKGAAVAVVDPRPVFLPFPFDHLTVTPDRMDLCAAVIVKRALSGDNTATLSGEAAGFLESLPSGYPFDPELHSRMDGIAQALERSERPVIVCGTNIVGESTPGLAGDLAHLLGRTAKKAGLFYLLPGPNAFGAGLQSSTDDPISVLETLEGGKIKALLLVEQDLFRSQFDQERLDRALQNLDCLIVLDYLPSPSVEKADLVLPTTPLFERTPSTFVNQEGRLQQATPVHRGGTPISQVGCGSRPPRTFEDHVPGGDPKAAHEVLDELYRSLGSHERKPLTAEFGDWKAENRSALEDSSLVFVGDRVFSKDAPDKLFSSKITPTEPREKGMEVLSVDWTFGTEELSGYSRVAQKGESVPKLVLHADDAARLGLVEGDKAALQFDAGETILEVGIATNMASGVIVVPGHRLLERQVSAQQPTIVPDNRIRKI